MQPVALNEGVKGAGSRRFYKVDQKPKGIQRVKGELGRKHLAERLRSTKHGFVRPVGAKCLTQETTLDRRSLPLRNGPKRTDALQRAVACRGDVVIVIVVFVRANPCATSGAHGEVMRACMNGCNSHALPA